MAKKTTTRAAAPSTPATTTETAPSISQKIRDYAAAHPEARPTDVAKALTEQGVKCNSARVSSVLRQATPKVDVESIKLAGAFVKEFENVEDAKNAIGSVGKFIDAAGSSTKALAALEAYEAVAAAMA